MYWRPILFPDRSEKGRDAGTALRFCLLIADVDIGNIGAQLQTDQAEADKKIAYTKAEEEE